MTPSTRDARNVSSARDSKWTLRCPLELNQCHVYHRLDLAKAAYEQAKLWAEDSLVIQLCEAWIGLKSVSMRKWDLVFHTELIHNRQGGEAYQSAYYVYDEIAQMPNANNVIVLNGKAIAQAAQGHWPEADAALTEASTLVSARNGMQAGS